MRLWLDDVRPAPEGWFWAHSSDEAILVLRSNEVKEISFDHDLGGDDTGYLVAEWIEECAFTGSIKPIKWTVHSANPVGRERINIAMQYADKYWGIVG